MTLSNSVTVQPQPGFASMLSSAVPMFLRTNEWRTVAPRSTLPASYTSSGTSRPPAGGAGAGPPSACAAQAKPTSTSVASALFIAALYALLRRRVKPTPAAARRIGPRGGARPLPHRRALGPRATPAAPLGPVAPVPPRPLAGVVGIVTAARLLVLAHRHLALLDRPVVLFALPPAVAGILEDRDPGKVDAALPARMVAPVLHVEHDAPAILVDHMPLVGGVDLPVLLHHRLDPGAHRLAATHAAVEVLEVPAVLGEEVGPGVPVLSHRAGAPVGAEGLLQLRAVELRHDPSFTRRRGRSRPRGSAFRAGLSARRDPCSRERRRPALPTGTPCASRPRRSRRAGSARAARAGRRRP